MPPELRKRKAPAVEPATAPPAKKKGPVAKAVAKVKEVVAPKPKAEKAEPVKKNGVKAAAVQSAPVGKVAVGDTIDLQGFGGEIETNDGEKTTLKKLVEESESGVVLFTYPKASTPGCTKQACLFRDKYEPLTATGFAIYGLSKDSPKSNTTFKEKQKLPYPLLCDPNSTLITAIGLKKAPAGITRGVFVVNKSGKVLAAEAGSPSGTVEVVEKLVRGKVDGPTVDAAKEEAPAANGVNGTNGVKEDIAKAEVAAEVADTAEKLDEAKA